MEGWEKTPALKDWVGSERDQCLCVKYLFLKPAPQNIRTERVDKSASGADKHVDESLCSFCFVNGFVMGAW